MHVPLVSVLIELLHKHTCMPVHGRVKETNFIVCMFEVNLIMPLKMNHAVCPVKEFRFSGSTSVVFIKLAVFYHGMY